MAKGDYYEILGIDKSDDEAAIKRAYRSLAMKYHPDRNPDDSEAAEKMKEINEAYAVLSDREKRRLYDTYGHAGLEGYTQEDIFRGVDFASLFREFGLGDFGFGRGFGFGDDLFESLFGGGGATRTRVRRKAADLRYDLDVTLEEVASGTEKKVDLRRLETCPRCQGTGAEEGGLVDCQNCRGTGEIVSERRSGYSIFRQISRCGVCQGRGQIIKTPCQECEGKGVLEKTKEISVQIPRGVDTGYRIKIEGEGEAGGDNIEPGDLYVVLNVQRHPLFERHGDDIYVAKEISFTMAALGGMIKDVPSLEGTLELDILEGTQTGTVFRVVGKGIPHLNDYGRGDEYVIVKVVTPTNLSEQEKELLRQFERLIEQRQRENGDTSS